MISFDKIDKYDWLYDLYMNYLCIAHNHIYYRHFYILNKENIPAKGKPTIVIANHQNGVMDALAILHTMFQDRRQPVFIARGDIFKKDGVARILRFLKIMPTFRTRDGNLSDVRSNIALYNRAAKVLKSGGTIVIFPEATHQHGHYMNTFKKGFCRIAFSAEEINDFKLGVQVLPLNIHYSSYFNFRSDLMVTVGKPFTFEELFDLYKETPNDAYLALNEKARARVKELTPDIDIPEYLNEIEAITQMMSRPYLKKKELNPDLLPNQKDAAMTIIATLKQYKEDDPEAFVQLMEDTKQYSSLLQANGLTHWVINIKPNMLRLVGRIAGMVISFPLFLFGYINNYAPRRFSKVFTDKAKDPMLKSSFTYVAGTVLVFPLCYMVIFALAWILSKSFWFALGYILLTFGTAFLVHYYKIWWYKLGTFFHSTKMRKTEAYQKMCQLNKFIVDTMENILK